MYQDQADIIRLSVPIVDLCNDACFILKMSPYLILNLGKETRTSSVAKN